MKGLPLLLPHYSGQLLLISMDSTRNLVACHNGPEIGQNQTNANSIGLILAHFWPCCYHLSYSDLFLVHAANISLILAHFWPMLPVSVWNWPISGPCCQNWCDYCWFWAHCGMFYMMEMATMKHVTQRLLLRLFFWYQKLIWRLDAHRGNLWLPDQWMSCSDLTYRQCSRIVIPVMATTT